MRRGDWTWESSGGKKRGSKNDDAYPLKISLYACFSLLHWGSWIRKKHIPPHAHLAPLFKITFDLIGPAIDSCHSLAIDSCHSLDSCSLHDGYNLCSSFWTGWLGGWLYCGLLKNKSLFFFFLPSHILSTSFVVSFAPAFWRFSASRQSKLACLNSCCCCCCCCRRCCC